MIYIIIGVSGVGKTTIGKALALTRDMSFVDADNFHPKANIDKMTNGSALTDTDRLPWLKELNNYLKAHEKACNIVLACSALKESYRVLLSSDLVSEVQWISLSGDPTLIHMRMTMRDHFMPLELLKSQLDTFEKPDYGLQIDVALSQNEILETINKHIAMKDQAQIGLIGLGVMGKSLSRNIARNNFKINVYNRHVSGKEEDVAKVFVKQYPELNQAKAYDDLPSFISSLSLPRKIILMVNAGQAVDAVIKELLPLLSADDIIIDGGNSHYKDTEKRYKFLNEKGIRFIGSGVSGGEEGALKGPSIMPGGSRSGYQEVSTILETIAAKDRHNKSCCAFIGEAGAGHFVKMVHNGIEYAEMQLIAEIYGILRFSQKKSPTEISEIFDQWCQTDTSSYLLEITAAILRKKEGEDYLIDFILDAAGNKGTGSWTTIAACELGVAIPTITAALYARYQSADIIKRQEASHLFMNAPAAQSLLNIVNLKIAYQQARLINHHQGYALIQAAAKEYSWNMDYTELSRIWTNGCIIRSELMEKIAANIAVSTSIVLNPGLNSIILDHPHALKELISFTSRTSLSTPCLSSALQYLNGFTEKRSLANIIQAQRDYFGAHTYERTDTPRGQKHHTQWT